MMPEFTTITYLRSGNIRQQEVFRLLTSHRIMEILAPFDPVLTGTIPLEIDLDTSDLDIICYCPDLVAFTHLLNREFGKHPDYQINESSVQGRPTVIGRFALEGRPVEIFGQHRPVREQEAFIHLVNEYRILLERGADFREQVLLLKRAGIKTEPAFAQVLGLTGDPYAAISQLYTNPGEDS